MTTRMPSSAARTSLASETEELHRNLDRVAPYLTSRGIGRDAAERFRLGFDPGAGRYGLTIPYLTPAGPWQIKRRCAQQHDCKTEGHDKYLGEAGVKPHLYNAQCLLTAERVLIVEGELDVVACAQAGIPAVGVPGNHAWKAMSRPWRWCFDSVDEVVVVADGDDPGRKLAEQVAASLRDSIPGEVKVVVMPDGFDANRGLAENGEDWFLEKIGWV